MAIRAGARSKGWTSSTLPARGSTSRPAATRCSRTTWASTLQDSAGPGNQTGILINGTGNAIGGTSGGVGNVIAFNTGDAVEVNSGDEDSIRSNLIYANGSAIVLQSGSNNGELPPTLSSATSSSGTTIITGSVPGGTPDGTILDFYGDATGQTPARTYLGSYVVLTTSVGYPAFTCDVIGGGVVAGEHQRDVDVARRRHVDVLR